MTSADNLSTLPDVDRLVVCAKHTGMASPATSTTNDAHAVPTASASLLASRINKIGENRAGWASS
jgi:hypothetical protein